MKNKNLINCILISLSAALILSISSCSSIKNVKYFTDIPDSGKNVKLNNIPFIEPTIQTDDILSVNIQVLDIDGPKTLSVGNQQSSAVGNSSVSGTGGQTVTGILVDRNGDVEFPVLGKVHVAGLTTEQAREAIRERTLRDYKNPSVTVRFANFKITILGEVEKPGTYVVTTERVNILDALGLAGDLTIYGKRDNIKLIRTKADGDREVVMLDLTKKAILNSPYYYLRQNDYIYVEPIKTKVVASDAIQNRNITITTTVISFLVSVIVVIIAKR
jgi:polysaccharide export outer membrane protein